MRYNNCFSAKAQLGKKWRVKADRSAEGGATEAVDEEEDEKEVSAKSVGAAKTTDLETEQKVNKRTFNINFLSIFMHQITVKFGL